PDFSAVALHDALADRQADTGSSMLASVQPLEDDEHFLGVSGIESRAIVTYREGPLAAGSLGGNMHSGRFVAPELDGISQQVLEEACKLLRMRLHRGQSVVRHFRLDFSDRRVQILERDAQGLLGFRALHRFAGVRPPRVIQQIVQQTAHAGYAFYYEARIPLGLRVQF